MSSINKFYPINVKGDNIVVGTYGNVCLLANGKTQLTGNTYTNALAVGCDISAGHILTLSGDTFLKGRTDVSGSLYVNGVSITSGGGGSQSLSSVLGYGNSAGTSGINMNMNDISFVNIIDVSNGASPISITNWDISSPAYSGATNKYSQYTGTGTYTGLSGYTFSTSTSYAYNVSIQYGTGGTDFITYFPFSTQQALSLQVVQNGNITMKSNTYTLSPGHYTVSFQLYAQDIGSKGQTVNFTVVNNSTSATLATLNGCNPVNNFPNWVKYTTNFSLAQTTTVYFNWYSPGPTSYSYSYVNFTGVQVTKYAGIQIHDTSNNVSILSSSSSAVNNLYVSNGLNVTSGGSTLTGGLNTYTSYGGDNIAINSIFGTVPTSINQSCIGVGQGTLQYCVSGNRVIAIGSGSSTGAVRLTDCTSVGTNVSFYTESAYNVGIGNSVRVGGSKNTVVGYMYDAGSMGNPVTTENVVIGTNAMTNRYNGYGALSSTQNVAIGVDTLTNMMDNYNTGIGYQSLVNIAGSNGVSTGGGNGYTTQYNTAVGYKSGWSPGLANNCTYLGANTDNASGVNNLYNSTAIGYGTLMDASNTIFLGSHGERVKISGDLSGVTTINGVAYTTPTLGQVLTAGNIASTSIDLSNFNLRNVTIGYIKHITNNAGIDTKISVNVDMSGNSLKQINTLSGVTTSAIKVANAFDMSSNNITNVGTLNLTTIDNPAGSITAGTGLNMNSHNVFGVLTLTTNAITTGGTSVVFAKAVDMSANDLSNVGTLTVSTINNSSNIAFGNNINMASHNINNVLGLGAQTLDATVGTTTTALGVNNALVTGKAMFVTGNTLLNGRTDVSGTFYVNGNPVTGGGAGSQTLAQTLTLGNVANMDIDMSNNRLQNVLALNMIPTTGAINMNVGNILDVNSIVFSNAGSKDMNMNRGNLYGVLSLSGEYFYQTQTSLGTPDFQMENINSSATTGVRLCTTKKRPAAGLSAGDVLFELQTYGTDSLNAKVQYASDIFTTVTTTAGAYEAKRMFATAQAGSMTNIMELGANINTYKPIIFNANGLQHAYKSISLTANASYSSVWANYCGNHVFVSQTTNGWTLTIGSAVTFQGGICAIENISSFDLTLTSGAGNFAGLYGNGTTSYVVYPGQIMRFVSNGTNWWVNTISGIPMTVRYVNTATQSITTTAAAMVFPTIETTSISAAAGIRTWNATVLTYSAGTFTNASGYPMTLMVEFTGGITAPNQLRYMGVNLTNATRNPYVRPKWNVYAATAVSATMTFCQIVHLGVGDAFQIFGQVTTNTTLTVNSAVLVTRLN